ncbi:MAG: hypothetical protein U9R68_06880 [Planctomycetota bacterium]|nr:hypothetical protein [Planctomycetota bacterium]
MMEPLPVLVLLVVGGGILLVAAVGLVMLIVGVLKKMTAVWIIGLVCLVPALLAAVVAVPVLMLVGFRATSMPVHRVEALSELAVPDVPEQGGDYVRMGGDVARARAAGVGIKVIRPGSGGASSSTSSSHGLDGWRREVDLRLGDVHLHVTDENGRITLRVGGRDYGRVHGGDEVLVTEDRRVEVNGVERSPGGARAGPRSRPF